MGNIISNNVDGIDINPSNCNNTIVGNTISDSYRYGVYFGSSCNNKVYLNNFINNGINACSYISIDFWNSTRPITYEYHGLSYTSYLGNYWSDYTGIDANGDGVGDIPYILDSSNQDDCPLVQPCENYLRE